jgi:hypothetical protein
MKDGNTYAYPIQKSRKDLFYDTRFSTGDNRHQTLPGVWQYDQFLQRCFLPAFTGARADTVQAMHGIGPEE